MSYRPALLLGAWAALTLASSAALHAAPTRQTAPVPTVAPRVTRPPTRAPSIMGIEAAQASDSKAKLMRDAGAVWLRRNGLIWSDVETQEGARNWSAAAVLEQELQTASRRGLQTILVVRSTPVWAQRRADTLCGPIVPEKLTAFGTFMRDVAARYTKPPFNVRYFEIGNEPDVDPSLVQSESPYGCWGNSTDPFYGGSYFAEALKVAYPQIKAASPQAQLVAGGLLLDCPPWACLQGKFLEGMLNAGGGAFVDVVNFHAYDFWSGQMGGYLNSNWASDASTGPVLIAKARAVKAMLAQYGLSKPVMNTETGLLCYQCGVPPAAFEATKAYYVPQAYAAAKAEGLIANVWYSLEGWNGSDLVNANLQPYPAMTAFKVASAALGRASFVREIADFPGVRGYELRQDGRRMWVMWSLSNQAQSVILPAAPTRIYDVFGQPIPNSKQLSVDLKPIYVQWPN